MATILRQAAIVHTPGVFLAVDAEAATDVAAAHHEAPRLGGALARAAYACLVSETDQLFQLITRADRPLHVFFTASRWPYGDADELIASIRRERVLEVTTAAREGERPHPLMGCEMGGAYDRFRAVHDALGHGLLNMGFDRDGEYTAWRFQEHLHSPLARRALATELHAEHSVRWTTGDPADHKADLLDGRVIERSRAAGRPARDGTTGPG